MVNASSKTATSVYGSSDDLIEFEGDVFGEIGCCGTSELESALVVFSDGTVLSIWYDAHGIWRIHPLRKGELLIEVKREDDTIEGCTDEARFAAGLKWAKYATEWDDVK